VFLSTAYLTSLATLVLIVYVMNPPVKDTIQGAYLVGIVMCGILFGAGALVFQDITEGLGCLLGGFALSMWFMTLKPGGLITSTGGRAIFIAAFCIASWSLSFSHYTRVPGLIGSTSFAGSTALVLGIDCFSKAGLKEFWIYIWHLNDNIFPLNTSTYPITKGMRVETVIIMLVTIIGVISQVRLWKVIRRREMAQETVRVEDERRRDVVEETLGRHLQRQNDKDRSEWEQRYGDRMNADRNTVLWSGAQSEKRFPSTSITEVGSSQHTVSTDSLEMSYVALTGQRPALRASKSKRQSDISAQAIAEVEEVQHNLSGPRSGRSEFGRTEQPHEASDLDFALSAPSMSDSTGVSSSGDQTGDIAFSSLRPRTKKPSSNVTEGRLHPESKNNQQQQNAIRSPADLKRRSSQSVLSRSQPGGETASVLIGESNEALTRPSENTMVHSRASSVAATLDGENEELELPTLEGGRGTRRQRRPPQIVISPALALDLESQLNIGISEPPSPSRLSERFEDDPEAVSRPPTNKAHGIPDFHYDLDHGRHSDGNTKGGAEANVEEGQIFGAEGLTEGALNRVPSQMSHVVLSYRTNEWAKHIATADEPMFEEPDPITVEDKELPTHLAAPALAISHEQEFETHMAAKGSKPPSPTMLVTPSEAGVKVNPKLQSMTALSRPGSLLEPAPPAEESTSCSPPQASSLMCTRRSLTDPIRQVHVPTSTRRTSVPLQRKCTLQGTAIDENTATSFNTASNAPNRSSSRVTIRESQRYVPGIATPDLIKTTSSGQHYPSAFKRQGTPEYSNPKALRPKTRLHDYNNTHQPLQRNNTVESHRRSALLANWRSQIVKKDQENYTKTRENEVWDQTMRTQGMIEAHREALRKMQSQVNKRLTQ